MSQYILENYIFACNINASPGNAMILKVKSVSPKEGPYLHAEKL